MTDFMEQCVERYIELSGRPREKSRGLSSPWSDEHKFDNIDLGAPGELSTIAANVITKVLFATILYRCDLLYLVGTLAREASRWTRALGKRLIVVCATLGAVLLSSDADSGGNPRTSNSTTGSVLAQVGENTFASIVAAPRGQIAVGHSSTEARVIDMAYTLRVTEHPALDLWGVVLPLCAPRRGDSAPRAAGLSMHNTAGGYKGTDTDGIARRHPCRSEQTQGPATWQTHEWRLRLLKTTSPPPGSS